jgi:sterol desaturase/sphingolipid hydroxylase (fatty acid hydroxylase superfamily)
MASVDYIHLAIPVFFLLIGVELLAARIVERDSYRLSDSVSDLSCGVLQQLADAFLRGALFAGYAGLYAGYRLADVPQHAPWAWAVCFVAQDFLYYWFHRFSHEVSAAWAAHVVHHQSEEYNLTVALRQGAFQPAISWVFYLPLALAGFPPVMFLAVASFNTLYQFWIHTRLVGRLGLLEWVLNTPSHHRVHHARNPRYIDRNHGGTLIVWDRLFGTFAAERQEPVYGVTRPLRSWNPVWANLDYWAELWDVARRARHPLDRLRVLWKPPGWRPADLGGPLRPTEVDRASYVKFDVPLAGPVKRYVLVQFTAVLLATTPYLQASATLGAALRSAGALAITWSLLSLGGLLERRAWAVALEAARLAALAAAAALGMALSLSSLGRTAGLAVLVFAFLSGLGLAWALRAARGVPAGSKGLPLPAELR